MSILYNKAVERLWEKLEYYRGIIDISCVDFKKPFPIDQLVEGNPFVQKLIDQVGKEYKYKMSEHQCSCAVNQFIKGGLKLMKTYSKKSKLNLKPRA